MSRVAVNFVILIVGLLLVSLLWIALAKGKEEKTKTAKFVGMCSAIGIIMYAIQVATGLGH